MNHRCYTANVRVEFNSTGPGEASTLDAVAMEEIAEGDELCIDYLGFSYQEVKPSEGQQQQEGEGGGGEADTLQRVSFGERQHMLKESYGFVCLCPQCKAGK